MDWELCRNSDHNNMTSLNLSLNFTNKGDRFGIFMGRGGGGDHMHMSFSFIKGSRGVLAQCPKSFSYREGIS